jgi:hypothetical protein
MRHHITPMAALAALSSTGTTVSSKFDPLASWMQPYSTGALSPSRLEPFGANTNPTARQVTHSATDSSKSMSARSPAVSAGGHLVWATYEDGDTVLRCLSASSDVSCGSGWPVTIPRSKCTAPVLRSQESGDGDTAVVACTSADRSKVELIAAEVWMSTSESVYNFTTTCTAESVVPGGGGEIRFLSENSVWHSRKADRDIQSAGAVSFVVRDANGASHLALCGLSIGIYAGDLAGGGTAVGLPLAGSPSGESAPSTPAIAPIRTAEYPDSFNEFRIMVPFWDLDSAGGMIAVNFNPLAETIEDLFRVTGSLRAADEPLLSKTGAPSAAFLEFGATAEDASLFVVMTAGKESSETALRSVSVIASITATGTIDVVEHGAHEYNFTPPGEGGQFLTDVRPVVTVVDKDNGSFQVLCASTFGFQDAVWYRASYSAASRSVTYDQSAVAGPILPLAAIGDRVYGIGSAYKPGIGFVPIDSLGSGTATFVSLSDVALAGLDMPKESNGQVVIQRGAVSVADASSGAIAFVLEAIIEGGSHPTAVSVVIPGPTSATSGGNSSGGKPGKSNHAAAIAVSVTVLVLAAAATAGFLIHRRKKLAAAEDTYATF